MARAPRALDCRSHQNFERLHLSDHGYVKVAPALRLAVSSWWTFFSDATDLALEAKCFVVATVSIVDWCIALGQRSDKVRSGISAEYTGEGVDCLIVSTPGSQRERFQNARLFRC